LVFTDDGGRPLRRNGFNDHIWRPAREAVGVPESTMHDLRHFFESLLIRAGLSVKVVAKLLGHQAAAMPWRVYAHLWPDDEDRSREAVDGALRRSDLPTLRPALER
jgi:integrase